MKTITTQATAFDSFTKFVTAENVTIVDAGQEIEINGVGHCKTELIILDGMIAKPSAGWHLEWKGANKAAQELGKLGGKVKSEAKTAAAKENGKKGGRPRVNFKIEFSGPRFEVFSFRNVLKSHGFVFQHLISRRPGVSVIRATVKADAREAIAKLYVNNQSNIKAYGLF